MVKLVNHPVCNLTKDTTSNSYAMGLYLNQYFKNEFYAIGFDIFKGRVNVLNEGEFVAHTFQADTSTFSNMLAQAKHKLFFLPLHADETIYGTTISLTNIYSNWQGAPKPLPVKSGIDFDAIMFIRDTSPSVRLSRE